MHPNPWICRACLCSTQSCGHGLRSGKAWHRSMAGWLHCCLSWRLQCRQEHGATGAVRRGDRAQRAGHQAYPGAAHSQRQWGRACTAHPQQSGGPAKTSCSSLSPLLPHCEESPQDRWLSAISAQHACGFCPGMCCSAGSSGFPPDGAAVRPRMPAGGARSVRAWPLLQRSVAEAEQGACMCRTGFRGWAC